MGNFITHEECPKCGSKDNLAVYDDGSKHCWTPTCGFHQNGEGEIPNVSTSSTHKLQLIHKVDYRELRKRNIDEKTCVKYGYGYGEYKGDKWQVATYRDQQGNIVAQHLRSHDKKFKWLKVNKDVDIMSLQLYGQHKCKNSGEWRKRLIITEGEIDCLSVDYAFNNQYAVVSIPSGISGVVKNLKANLEFISGYDEVIIMFDNDEQGREGTKKALEVLGTAKIVSYPADCKDANDVLLKHGRKELCTCVYNASIHRPDGIISGEDLEQRLLNLYEGRLNPEGEHQSGVYPIDIYPQLNEMMGRGIRLKKLYTILAGSGNGKSTIAKEIMYHLMMEHNLKVGMVCLEESAEETGELLMSLYLNRRLHLLTAEEQIEFVPREDYVKAMKDVVMNKRMFTYDSFGAFKDIDNLLSRIKFFLKGLDCDVVLFDHITIAVTGIDDSHASQVIAKVVKDLREIVEETGKTIIMISHLRKGSDSRKPHEEGGRVYTSDVFGSNAILQVSDFMFAIEGNPQSKKIGNYRLIRVLKNRIVGAICVGTADVLEYIPETGRLIATEHSVEDINDLFKEKEDGFRNREPEEF